MGILIKDGVQYGNQPNISGKVDKVTGKGLSTNDYTDADKNKLNEIEAGAQINTITGVKGDAELSYREGNINLTPANIGAIPSSEKGAANGVAELDSGGKVPSSQLPSYVDDVLEYASTTNFPATGETGKIYVDTSTNKTWRWSGSNYVEISASLALGETSSTAYRGDRGKTAYDHATAKGAAFTSGLYKITTNSEGHVTAATSVEKNDITALGIPGQDTKNTAGSTDSSSKLFLIGATSQAENPQTYSHDTAYVGTDGCLYSGGTKVLTAHQDVSGKKNTQSAVNSPTASGTAVAFIDTISQNTQGVITATKKTVANASTSAAGLMSAADKQKLDGIATGAQVNTITGVKGNAESSYRTGNVNLTAENIGALPLTGGVLTGQLIRKEINIDASKANNNLTNDTYPTTFGIIDAQNRVLTRLEGVIESNGRIGSHWFVDNYDINGQSLGQKGITMSLDKTGELTYYFSNRDKARTALGAGTVNKISTGAGLTGGDVTTTGTIKAKLKSETKSSLTSTSMGSTSGRQYAVGLDSDGNLSVNIPWTDNNIPTYVKDVRVTSEYTGFDLRFSETEIELPDEGGTDIWYQNPRTINDYDFIPLVSKDYSTIGAFKPSEIGSLLPIGVKGDAESSYRTGQVNITPANIGAYSKAEADASELISATKGEGLHNDSLFSAIKNGKIVVVNGYIVTTQAISRNDVLATLNMPTNWVANFFSWFMSTDGSTGCEFTLRTATKNIITETNIPSGKSFFFQLVGIIA